MSLTRRIAHNTFLQLAGKAVSMLLSLTAIALVIRHLGQEGFGHYTTIIAYLQFFGIIVDFGLAVIIVQLISSRPAETEKLTNNIFTFRLVTAVVFFALAPLFIWFFPYPEAIKWGTAITTASLFFVSLNQILVGLFQRELKMIWTVLADVVSRLFLLIGTILVISQGWHLFPILVVATLANGVMLAMNFYSSRRIVKIKLAFDWSVWREVFAKSWPIGLSIIFNLVYFKADTIILSLYRPQAEVGVYGATYKILEVLSSVPYMFVGLILPLLAAAWAAHDRERFLKVLQKAWDFMALITLPMMAGGFILAEPIMTLVAGREFSGAAPVLQILILATGAIYLSTVFNHAIIALEQQRKILKGFAAVAVISLTGYLIFIPIYSYWAAAWFTLLAEVLILIISALVVYRALKKFVNLEIFGKALLASILMALILLALNWAGAELLLSLIVGGGVYCLLMYWLGGIKGTVEKILGRE
jgi:O-antigen/teichoic acid export membrane protein